jgi:hypothetical protein
MLIIIILLSMINTAIILVNMPRMRLVTLIITIRWITYNIKCMDIKYNKFRTSSKICLVTPRIRISFKRS